MDAHFVGARECITMANKGQLGFGVWKILKPRIAANRPGTRWFNAVTRVLTGTTIKFGNKLGIERPDGEGRGWAIVIPDFRTIKARFNVAESYYIDSKVEFKRGEIAAANRAETDSISIERETSEGKVYKERLDVGSHPQYPGGDYMLGGYSHANSAADDYRSFGILPGPFKSDGNHGYSEAAYWTYKDASLTGGGEAYVGILKESTSAIDGDSVSGIVIKTPSGVGATKKWNGLRIIGNDTNPAAIELSGTWPTTVGGGALRIGGYQVVGPQEGAVADAGSYSGISNTATGSVFARVSDLNALAGKFDDLLSKLRSHGLIAGG